MVQQLSLTGNIKEALARLLKWISFNTSFSLEMIDFQSSHGQPATFQRFFGWIFYDAAKAHHVVPKVCFCREASPERKGLVYQKLHTLYVVWFGLTLEKQSEKVPRHLQMTATMEGAFNKLQSKFQRVVMIFKNQLDPRNLTYIYIYVYLYVYT